MGVFLGLLRLLKISAGKAAESGTTEAYPCGTSQGGTRLRTKLEGIFSSRLKVADGALKYRDLRHRIAGGFQFCADLIFEVGRVLPVERFLDLLIDRVGYSSYLKEQIRTELKASGDSVTQITVLQGAIRDL